MTANQDYRRSRQLLSLTIIFFWASEYCHAPYFTPYLETLGFAATTIGFITGAYGFTQMCVRIPLGIVTDATGAYKRTILLGTVLTTQSSFGLIFVTNLVPIMVFRVMAGLAASTWIAFTILFNAYYKADESVQAMANINAYNNAGKFLAFVLGMVTSSIWGYRIPLVCSFLTGCAAALCALRLKPITLRREPFRISHMLSALKNPEVLVAAGFAVIVQFFMQGTVFSFTSAVAKGIGATPFQIGLATVLYTVVQIVCAGFVGRKLLKWISSAAAVAVGLGLLAVSALLVGGSTSVYAIFAGQLIAGFANLMLNAVLMSMVVRSTPQERQSTAMCMYQAIYGLGMSAGPVMIGRMVSSGTFASAYRTVALMMVIAAIVAPGLIMWAGRRGSRSRE